VITPLEIVRMYYDPWPDFKSADGHGFAEEDALAFLELAWKAWNGEFGKIASMEAPMEASFDTEVPNNQVSGPVEAGAPSTGGAPSQ